MTISARITLARNNINWFIPQVIKDENGKNFAQAKIHRSWHDHIEYSRSRKKHACIIAPWGHGKSAQLVVGRTLWEIGRNPNIRIKIVSNSDENAKARVAAVRRYIEGDAAYHNVFPEIKPAKREAWTHHRLFIKRTARAHSIDPTLEAKGILATGIGGRCDGIIFDDPVDHRNAIESPALQPKVIDAFKNVWLSRLEPGGWCLYVATRWTESDLTAMMLTDPEISQGYCFLIQAISEDFQRIECMRIG